MTQYVITNDGDVLDAIVYRHYGRSDMLAAVLEANTGISRLPPVLPAGLVIVLPDLPAPAELPVIRLWS